MILFGTLRLIFESAAQGGDPFPLIGVRRFWSKEQKYASRRWDEFRAISPNYQETLRRHNRDSVIQRQQGERFARRLERLLNEPPFVVRTTRYYVGPAAFTVGSRPTQDPDDTIFITIDPATTIGFARARAECPNCLGLDT